jgi:O-antigen/teichoic acid export membrane protein
VAAVAAGLVLRGELGVVVALCGPIWFATAEAYVRKSAALKLGRVDSVVRAEILGAATMLVAVAVIVATRAPGVWIGVGLAGKSAVEALSVRDWRGVYRDGAPTFRPGAEWFGQIMTYLVANTDYVLIALLLGPVDLSLYVIAYQATAAVPVLAGKAFMQVTFLDSSAAASAGERQRAYRTHVRRAGALGLAGGLGVAVVAPVMPLVLGTDWEPIVPLMVILAVSVPARMLLGITVAQAITAGAARAVVRWEAGRLVATATAVAVAASTRGLVATAAAVAAISTASIAVEHVRSCRVADVHPDRLVVPWAIAACILAVGLAAALG